MTNPSDKRPVIVCETPEMANWMHPQTEERKELIRKQLEETKNRFAKVKQNPVLRQALRNSARKGKLPKMALRINGSVIVTHLGGQISCKKVSLQQKSRKMYRKIPLLAQHKS